MKYLDFLKNVPLFSGLSPAELQALLETLRVERAAFAAGETLLRTGEIIDRFGILLAGRVEIVKEDFEGNQTLVAQITPGHIFAEAFACSRAPLTVTVQAGRSGAEVLWLSYADLFAPHGELDAVCRQIGQRLLESFASKNLFLTGRIEHLAKRSLREKVLSYLSGQATAAGSRSFDIPLDRRQMADYLAADRSALSAVLGKLQEEGVLQFWKNHFTLL